MKRKSSLFVGTVLCALCSAASAGADLDTEALRACAAEKDDGLRLACYDREVRGLPSHPAATTPAPRAPVPDVTQQFGARGGEIARKQAREEEKVQLKQVTARVTELSERRGGERVFKLDNEQVWVEKTRAAYLPVKVGDVVTITAGALSSYRLSEASGRTTQVKRVE